MLATLIALALSLLFYFWPVTISQETVAIVLACTGGAFLLSVYLFGCLIIRAAAEGDIGDFPTSRPVTAEE